MTVDIRVFRPHVKHEGHLKDIRSQCIPDPENRPRESRYAESSIISFVDAHPQYNKYYLLLKFYMMQDVAKETQTKISSLFKHGLIVSNIKQEANVFKTDVRT
jgi:hypothetical protein